MNSAFLPIFIQRFLHLSRPWSDLMLSIHYSLLLHFVGIGMIFTSLLGGMILNTHYRRANEYATKMVILKSLGTLSLLGPIGVVVMLASGVGNMTLGDRQYTLFSDAWLSVKLVFFIVVVMNGLMFGAKGRTRAKLAEQLAEGTAPAGTEVTLAGLDKQQRLFYIFQTILILVILTLSIVKPGNIQ